MMSFQKKPPHMGRQSQGPLHNNVAPSCSLIRIIMPLNVSAKLALASWI